MAGSRIEHIAQLRRLHLATEPLVLVNAWDAASARAVAEVPGVRAIATASESIAAAHGYEDGERMPLELMLAAVGRIVDAVDLPVTADLEAGYGDARTTFRRAIELGVAGANLEDGMRPLAEAVRAVEDAIEAGRAAGASIVLNGPRSREDAEVPRITIVDVARRAGVSKGAASHALNGRKGVSDATRVRVLQAAEDLGWVANPTARALSGSRAGAVGWVIVQSAKSPTIDPYYTELFSGVELALAGTDTVFVVKLVADRHEETALYRRWAAERRVDGVLLTDLDDDHDRRFALLAELGLPFAALRSTLGTSSDPGEPSVWMDERIGADRILDEVLRHGHRRITWISGDEERHAVRLRRTAADEWADRHEGTTVRTLSTDLSPAEGVRIAREVLRGDDAPTCIVFDNDLMAFAAVTALEQDGLRIPQDLSVVSFIDSPFCELPRVPLTALRHPIVEYGELMTSRLLGVLSGVDSKDLDAPAGQLHLRASVGTPSH